MSIFKKIEWRDNTTEYSRLHGHFAIVSHSNRNDSWFSIEKYDYDECYSLFARDADNNVINFEHKDLKYCKKIAQDHYDEWVVRTYFNKNGIRKFKLLLLNKENSEM